MLDLMYQCLSLGFEGKYRVLSREVSPHWQGLKDTRRRLVRIVPWWLVALFTLMCLVMMYAGFAWVLGEQRDTVLKPYQQLDPASGVSMDDQK